MSSLLFHTAPMRLDISVKKINKRYIKRGDEMIKHLRLLVSQLFRYVLQQCNIH